MSSQIIVTCTLRERVINEDFFLFIFFFVRLTFEQFSGWFLIVNGLLVIDAHDLNTQHEKDTKKKNGKKIVIMTIIIMVNQTIRT